MCQGLRSCVYMFCFKSSSSRGSIIIDVKCDGGSSKSIHCKTKHLSQIVSDNATNLVGARRDLNKLEKVVRAGAQSYSSIEWLFIPPPSRNFGGLWEAAVKSMKHHLRRVMGDSILNYEEMTTILFQIEQVLNNRPLMALTNYPDDIVPSPRQCWSMTADWMLSHSPAYKCRTPNGIQLNDFAVFNSYSLNFGNHGLLSS